MDEPGGVVEEERIGFVLPKKGEGIVAVLMKGEAVFIEPESVVFSIRGEAREPVRLGRFGNSPVRAGPIEALVFRLRKGVVIDRHVPFSGVPGGVASLLESFGKGHFARRHAATVPRGYHGVGGEVVGRGRVAADNVGLLRTGRMVPAHDGAARGCAGGSGRVGLPEFDAFLRESIEIRCLHGRWVIDIVALHILPAEVIGEDEDDIGLRRPCAVSMQGSKKSEKNE